MIKLHVFLRDKGIASRRGAEELIQSGKVKVDGKIAHIGQLITGNEKIEVEDINKIRVENAEKKYILLDKPTGVTSTTEDIHAEQTVLELLPYELRQSSQWQIAGRLDKNSEGIMLLTNDGDVVYVLTHPKFEVPKTYLVKTAQKISDTDKSKLLKGVTSEGGVDYKFQNIQDKGGFYEVVLIEGKKREIREAFKILENEVVELRRVAIGPLSENLLEGEPLKELNTKEIEILVSYITARKEKVSHQR